jgi:HPt (histidine-containing phosphotransfer) domain-containing protein
MADEHFKRIRIAIDEDLAELIPGFLENRRKDVAAISPALEKSDYETVQRIGHDMKGVGGSYGFEAITDLGAALETAARRQDGSEIRKQTDALRSYLDRIDIVYE